MITAGWNVLLYAIAEDGNDHARIVDAIDGMQHALTSHRCNVAVQLHARSKTTRHWLVAGRRARTETLPVVADASDPSSLTGFLDAVNRSFPGKSTALMLWAHGGGLDTNVGMKQAIAASVRRRVELLGLNACWMASLEVAYELRSVSDVQVASQVHAQPWPYAAIIEALEAAPDVTADQLAQVIVASVGSEIMADKRRDAVSAFWSGAALDELALAFDAYAKRVTTLLDASWEAVANAVMVEAQRVDDPCQADLMSLIHTLGKQDLKAKIAAASVDAKLRAMVLASAASDAHPGAHGLSIFCPSTTRVELAAAYRGTEFHGNSWTQFLKAFQIRLARAASA